MKTMKKLASLVLAVVFCLSVVNVTALAADPAEQDGTITIKNVEPGETYSVYKIFDLTYAAVGEGDHVSTAYSYKLCDAWKDFFNGQGTAKYFTIDNNGYLDPASSIFEAEDQSSVMASFAKEALAFAKDNEMEATAKHTAAKDAETLVFEDLPLGYYVVDTSLGTICMLTSTTPIATLVEKNTTPTNELYVRDITDKDLEENFVITDNADVIDRLQYEIILDTVQNLHNLCLHDSLDSDLILDENSFSVYTDTPNNKLRAGNLAISTERDEYGHEYAVYDVTDGDYAILFQNDESDTVLDGCSFEIHFSDSYLSTLTAEDQIYVIYEADIAVPYDDFSADYMELDNMAHVSYGLTRASVPLLVSTSIYGFDVFKFTEIDDNKTPLAGAQFVLSYVTGEPEQEVVHYATFTQNGKNYELKSWDGDTENLDSIITSVDEGNVSILGLEAHHTYYLTEIAAPAGYNMLKKPVEIKFVVDADNAASFTVTYDGEIAANHVVPVENNQGSMLPGTGGIGTTVFYVAGVILILGAAVILITRRRMAR